MQELHKNIIIAAGGTGGHLYPGLALARELIRRGYNIVFFIRRNDASKDILAKDGFAFIEIPVRGMPRKLSLQFFTFFYMLVKGWITSAVMIKKLKPAVVVGMGGYISFPAVSSARFMGSPAVIHEQNSLPGLSNKLLSRLANTIAVSFKSSMNEFPQGKAVYTGNPIRAELFSTNRTEACVFFDISPDIFTVFVFGGSQGAAGINRNMAEAIPMLAEYKNNVQFIHITGKNDASIIEDAYKKHGLKARVFAYLHEIQYAYAASDLVICRAGATTVAEVTLLQKCAVFIPFPYATANHQEYNVTSLLGSDCYRMIREKDLAPALLAKEIAGRLAAYKQGRKPAVKPEQLPQAALADIVEKAAAL